jgi:cell division protein ZapA (FtsZ GTPase activity inhibitor)
MEEITTIIESATNSEDYTGQVDRYVQLINTYGASAVIIAVFLVVLLLVVTYLLRSNQKTNNQLIKQQQDLVNMLVELAKGEKEQNTKPKIVKEPNLVELFLNINGSIKDTLKDISDELNADRTSVYVFHNGVFSSHGLPFFKISCVCEIVKKNTGVVKNLNNHSGLPLQMFDNTISNIYKNGSMTIVDTDDENDDIVINSPILCGMLKTNNIHSATGIAIYDHDNNIMGILMVEYVDTKSDILLDEAVKYLIDKAPLLSPILEYSGIYDIKNNNN